MLYSSDGLYGGSRDRREVVTIYDEEPHVTLIYKDLEKFCNKERRGENLRIVEPGQLMRICLSTSMAGGYREDVSGNAFKRLSCVNPVDTVK
jgi:hypothetical protein